MTIHYYKFVSADKHELLAIVKGIELRITIPCDFFSDKLGTRRWWWDTISESEFGTYQVFGIREIRLNEFEPWNKKRLGGFDKPPDPAILII